MAMKIVTEPEIEMESWSIIDRNGVPRYDVKSAFTKNRFISYIIGARGYGKTYGFKKELIIRAIKDPDNKRFIYLRRYITEVEAITNWFGNIANDPDLEKYAFDVRGRKIRYMVKEEYREEGDSDKWQIIGMIYALTESKKIKSQDYPEYLYMVYDEWLAEEGSDFLKGEPSKLLNLIHSIFREKNFQVFCLANATILHNPYFSFFNFYPNISKQFTYDRLRNQMIQMIPAGNFVQYSNTTAMGILSQGTVYHDYAFGNEFNDDDDTLVEPRDGKTTNEAILILDERTKMGVWKNKEGMFWFSEKYNNDVPNKYSLDPKLVNEDYKAASVFYKSFIFQQLRTAKEWSDIRFDTKRAKGKAAPIVKAMKLFI